MFQRLSRNHIGTVSNVSTVYALSVNLTLPTRFNRLRDNKREMRGKYENIRNREED